MTTYFWEKKESAGSWVPFEGTPTAQNPTEEFEAGTWDVRVTASLGSQSDTKTRNAYVTVEEAPSYVGPLDLVPGAVAAYSVPRALTVAKLGADAYLLENDDTDTETFAYDAVTGLIDVAAINIFKGAGNAHSNNFYDQATAGGSTSQMTWGAALCGGKPGFVGVDGSPSGVSVAAGARTVAYVVDYVEDAGVSQIFWKIEGGDNTATVELGSFWNNANDLYVAYTDIDGVNQRIYITTSTLTTGTHLIEVQVSAGGVVTILVDGDDFGAVIDSGSPYALPAKGGGASFDISDNISGPGFDFSEAIMWPQQNIGAPARANIMDFYGIS